MRTFKEFTSRETNEAQRVSLADLDSADQKIVKDLEKILATKHTEVHSGGMGNIVHFPNRRFPADAISKLGKMKFRWLHVIGKDFVIGF